MSKILNRLLVVDTFTRQGVYYSGNKLIKDYFDINSIDILLNKIKTETNGLITNKQFCYLLYKQKEDIVDCLKNEILKNETIYSRYIANKKINKYITFENLEEFNIFKKAMYTDYYNISDNFVYAFRNGLSLEKTISAIEFFERNDIGINNGNCKVNIYNRDIDEFISNSFIWEFSDKDILNIITNINELELDFGMFNKEQLTVLTNHNSIYLYEINQENLDLINNIASIISDGPEDTDEDNAFYGYSHMGGNTKRCLYNLRDGVNEYINTITGMYAEKETQKELLYSLLGAIECNFISDVSKLNLITNKIKYGFKPKSLIDIGLDILGMNLETYNELGVGAYNIASLITFKNELPKGFFRKVINSTKLIRGIMRINCSVLSKVSNILELGQLNENQIEEIINISASSTSSVIKFTQYFSDVEYKLSFDEFMYIYNNIVYISSYDINNIKDMKQSARLLKLKSIVKINETLKDKRFAIDKSIVQTYIADKDMLSLIKTDNPLDITDIGDFIEYKTINSIIPISSVSYLNKIKLLLNNGCDIVDLKDLTPDEIDLKIWSSDEVTKVINNMNLSDAFKEEYKDNIINFLSSEDYHLVNSYYKNRYSYDIQRKSIILIGKSIIANKYEDLKFVRDDIKKEISKDISDEAFDAWKRTDLITKGAYTVQDSSDFRYIMRMGEIPVRTCMNYIDGMYSTCLLSNFDTSKKMMIIHKNGKYVGRAIIRLTVMSDSDSKEAHLNFVDVDNNSNSSESKHSNNLILFLEKAYTTLDNNDFKECYAMMVELLKDKANEMGAQLVTSNNYRMYIENDCVQESKYVFITASKNGSQYLDSFDGSTSTSYCYKKGLVNVYPNN